MYISCAGTLSCWLQASSLLGWWKMTWRKSWISTTSSRKLKKFTGKRYLISTHFLRIPFYKTSSLPGPLDHSTAGIPLINKTFPPYQGHLISPLQQLAAAPGPHPAVPIHVQQQFQQLAHCSHQNLKLWHSYTVFPMLILVTLSPRLLPELLFPVKEVGPQLRVRVCGPIKSKEVGPQLRVRGCGCPN